jgi:uncharacterized circularly permuted ATP-grasp superfamily protein
MKSGLFDSYVPLPGAYDEMVSSDGTARPHARGVYAMLNSLSASEFARYQSLAELSLFNQGVTFSVYSDKQGTEKIFPICLAPRVIAAREWAKVEVGLAQRIAALNMFLDDMYGEQRILRDGIIPAELVLAAKQYEPKLRGIRPPGGVRIPIAGIDLIRGPDGVFRVLEDNVRTPSGVSYVVENRLVTKRLFRDVVDMARVRQVEQYPMELAQTLRAIAPHSIEDDELTMVVLTPGIYNSAYFEHSFLARHMGISLVEPSDLFVEDLSAHRRCLPRSGVLPPRQSAGGAWADGGLRCRPRDARQRARQRHRGRQGRLPLRARHDPLLPGRGALARAGGHLRVRA